MMEKMEFLSSFLSVNSRFFRVKRETIVKIMNKHHKNFKR